MEDFGGVKSVLGWLIRAQYGNITLLITRIKTNIIFSHQLVKGLYTWCHGCGHGGHLACYQNWDHATDIQHSTFDCPAGCGHLCKVN
jgi:hypothetical protein